MIIKFFIKNLFMSLKYLTIFVYKIYKTVSRSKIENNESIVEGQKNPKTI